MPVNHVMIIGNLGQDPEVVKAKSGNNVCHLRIAVNRPQMKHDNGEEITDWFNVSAYGKTGENCAKYLSKGRQVCVEGRLEVDTWVDDNGHKRESYEIRAVRVEFLGGSNDKKR